MPEYLPVLIVGAIIGVFTVIFLVAFLLEKDKKKSMGFERNMDDREVIRRLLQYARPYRGQFVLVFFIMAVSVVYDVVSPRLVGSIEEMVKDNFALSQLYGRVAIYASILIVSLICTYAQAMLLQKVGQKILSQIRMDVFTDMPGMQLYSSNFFGEQLGKGGRRMGRRGSVALETQLWPDAMNHWGFPSPVLRRGEKLHSLTSYRFSVNK